MGRKCLPSRCALLLMLSVIAPLHGRCISFVKSKAVSLEASCQGRALYIKLWPPTSSDPILTKTPTNRARPPRSESAVAGVLFVFQFRILNSLGRACCRPLWLNLTIQVQGPSQLIRLSHQLSSRFCNTHQLTSIPRDSSAETISSV